MRTSFGPDDESEFIAARDELVSRFELSPGGHEFGWIADQVMSFKWGYLDGDLAHWELGDIEHILLYLYPRKVVLDPEDLDEVIAGFAMFLEFLADEGILARNRATQLATSVRRLAPTFRIAALDERNWSMGKRLWSQAQSEGVDVSEPDALQRFMNDFNQRTFDERDAILGPSPENDDPLFGGMAIDPLPPVALPPMHELESSARNTVAYTRLRRLLDYVGDGRPLTAKGNLKLADGKALVELLETRDRFDPKYGDRVFKTKSSFDLHEVDLTLQMALETKMLVREGKKLVPGSDIDLIDDPLEALFSAWIVTLILIGPTQHWYRNERYNWDWYAADLDEALVMILIDLYRDGDTSIEEFVERSWSFLLSGFDLDSVSVDRVAFYRGSVESSLRRAFDILVRFGTIRVEDVVEEPNKYGGTDRTGGIVGLTPLGKWTVNSLASTVTSAPIVGAFRDLTATELLVAASDIPEDEAVAEIDIWVEHHGDDAPQLLADALRTIDETGRGLGFRALLGIGPSAADAVGSLADDVDLAPYVTVWRVDTLTAQPGEMDCSDDPERFVRLMGAVIEIWGPEAAVAGWAEPASGSIGIPSMVEKIWRVELPLTEQVLAAISSEHSNKTAAKAARKALFKYRTAR